MKVAMLKQIQMDLCFIQIAKYKLIYLTKKKKVDILQKVTFK